MNKEFSRICRLGGLAAFLSGLLVLFFSGVGECGERGRDRQRGESVGIDSRPSGDSSRPGQGKSRGSGAGQSKGEVVHITDDEVAAAVRRGMSAVYFWAEWCGPCRTQGPIMDTVAKKYAGKVKIFKMNVDHEKRTAEKFEVSQIPTMILFRNGRPAVKLIGVIQESEFDEEIEELMKRPPPKERDRTAPGGRR